jgi:predicted dehydrogenase
MCISLEQCDKLIAAEKKSGKIVQIGFQRRADPRFIEPMKLVHAGELGELVEGRVCWSNSWGPLADWFGRKERSGDWMVEQAVHNWDIMNWANACKPKRAMGLGMDKFFKDVQPERNVHDYYSGVLEYENGVVVNIVHSWVPPRLFDKEYSWLIGTKGGVDFNTGRFSYRDPNKEDRFAFGGDKNIDNTKLAFEAFLKSVTTRSPSIAPPSIGREAVLTCLLMREAVYRQKPVTLKDLKA